MQSLSEHEKYVLDDMLARRPDLVPCTEALIALHAAIVSCYDHAGKLLLCGNGGSFADASHIAGELCKSFECKRPLPSSIVEKLNSLPYGTELQAHLEAGLPAIPLGLNGALKTAVENDSSLRDIAFAQETVALSKPGDVLIALSTSGNARNCLLAVSTAKACGLVTAAFTGPSGGELASCVDIIVRAPGSSTKVVQEAHLALYHALCAMVEVHYFPEPRQ